MKQKHAVCLMRVKETEQLAYAFLPVVGLFPFSISNADSQSEKFYRKAEVGALQSGVEVLFFVLDSNHPPKAPGDITIMSGTTFQKESEWKTMGTLEGYRVLPRTTVEASRLLVDRIAELGGISELSNVDADSILEWPAVLSTEFTRREMEIVVYKNLEQAIAKYAVDGQVFIKTKKKSFGSGVVVGVDELADYLFRGMLPYLDATTSGKGHREAKTISPETELVISQPINFPKRGESVFGYEYRAFVVNSKPAHIFTYPVAEDENVPKNARQFAGYFAEKNRDILPRHYVVDIGMLADETYAVVELNPFIHSAGLNRRGMCRLLKALGYSSTFSRLTQVFFTEQAQEVDQLPT